MSASSSASDSHGYRPASFFTTTRPLPGSHDSAGSASSAESSDSAESGDASLIDRRLSRLRAPQRAPEQAPKQAGPAPRAAIHGAGVFSDHDPAAARAEWEARQAATDRYEPQRPIAPRHAPAPAPAAQRPNGSANVVTPPLVGQLVGLLGQPLRLAENACSPRPAAEARLALIGAYEQLKLSLAPTPRTSSRTKRAWRKVKSSASAALRMVSVDRALRHDGTKQVLTLLDAHLGLVQAMPADAGDPEGLWSDQMRSFVVLEAFVTLHRQAPGPSQTVASGLRIMGSLWTASSNGSNADNEFSYDVLLAGLANHLAKGISTLSDDKILRHVQRVLHPETARAPNTPVTQPAGEPSAIAAAAAAGRSSKSSGSSRWSLWGRRRTPKMPKLKKIRAEQLQWGRRLLQETATIAERAERKHAGDCAQVLIQDIEDMINELEPSPAGASSGGTLDGGLQLADLQLTALRRYVAGFGSEEELAMLRAIPARADRIVGDPDTSRAINALLVWGAQLTPQL